MADDSGWPVVPFGDLCEHSAFGPRFSSDEYALDGNIACLRTKDIDFDGRIDFDEMPLANLEPSKFQGHYLQRGDLVITRTGAYLGKTAVFSEFKLPVLAGAFLIRFQLNRRIADPWFFRFLFSSRDGQALLRSIVTGTAQPNLNITNLHTLRVPLPPLPEQRAIASILGALDDKIELNRRMNETLEGMARAIFKSWFVDFDPVRAKMEGRQPAGMDAATAALFPDSFQDSPLGKIPAGWKVGCIADLADYVNGRNFTKNATGTGRMVIRIAELNSGPGGSTKYNDVDANPENIAFPDDILFAWSGSLDVYRWHRPEALINQHIFKVICRGSPPWFVFHHLREAMPVFQSIAAHKATTMGHIKRQHLTEVKHAAPHRSLLDAATSLIGPLFSTIHTYEVQSRALTAIRDALLPKLLSGELRVPDAEAVVHDAIENNPDTSQIGHTDVNLAAPDRTDRPTRSKVTTPQTTANHHPRIDDYDDAEIMVAFRQACRRQGEMERDELLRAVSHRLGFQRLGSTIRESLKGHLRAAIRRKIIGANGHAVWADTRSMADYTRDELISTLRSVMRKRKIYERDDVIQDVARHLGFARVRDSVREPIRSAINGAIRRGVLEYEGTRIWRGD